MTKMILYSKWGSDGSSHQSEYKQVLSEEDVIPDSNFFIASFVPIKILDEATEQEIWLAFFSQFFVSQFFIEFEQDQGCCGGYSKSDIFFEPKYRWNRCAC